MSFSYRTCRLRWVCSQRSVHIVLTLWCCHPSSSYHPNCAIPSNRSKSADLVILYCFCRLFQGSCKFQHLAGNSKSSTSFAPSEATATQQFAWSPLPLRAQIFQIKAHPFDFLFPGRQKWLASNLVMLCHLVAMAMSAAQGTPDSAYSPYSYHSALRFCPKYLTYLLPYQIKLPSVDLKRESIYAWRSSWSQSWFEYWMFASRHPYPSTTSPPIASSSSQSVHESIVFYFIRHFGHLGSLEYYS